MTPDPVRIARKLRDVADRLEDTGQQFLDETREDHRGFGSGSTVHVAGGDHSDPTWEAVRFYGPELAHERREAIREMNELYERASSLSARLHRLVPASWERCSDPACGKRLGGQGMPRAIRFENLPYCPAHYEARRRKAKEDAA